MFYFIVNITSRAGKAESIWKTIEEELHRRNVEYEAFLTSYEGHAGKLAEELCKNVKGEVPLVIVGGDGTVNEVINGISDFSRISLGYIPTGSGNDLGRGLRLPKDPIAVLEKILDGKDVRYMDIGGVTTNLSKKERFFAISSGIGLDADVCEEANRSKLKKILNNFGLGKLTYLLLTVKRVFTMPVLKVQIVDETGAVKHYERVVFAAAMNHYAEGGGVPMAPKASAFDGTFHTCIFWGHNRFQSLCLFPVLIAGKHDIIKRFEIISYKEYSVETEKPVVLHVDGEYGGLVQELHYRCHKGKLKILV